MKATTKLQFRIQALSKGLPEISERQLRWAEKQALDKMFIYDGGLQKWCGKCGHVWKGDRTKRKQLRCPNCGKLSYRYTTRNESQKSDLFFSTTGTVEDLQLVRCYEIIVRCKKGQAPVIDYCETARNWITPDFKMVAYLRSSSYYNLSWTSDMTLRGTFTFQRYNRVHYTISTMLCPIGKKFIPELSRIGADKCTNFSYGDIERILRYPIFETAMKLGYGKVAERVMEVRRKDLLPALKIAIRHNYRIDNASMWVDTMEMLSTLKKDIHNPVFVCPENLKQDHDKWMNIIRERDERARREQEREQRIREQERLERFRLESKQSEQVYAREKGKYLDKKIMVNGITFRVIPTVEDFLKIGSEWHICIFTNRYYEKSNSLLLTAKKRNRTLAVMEMSIDTGKCLQSRAKYNDLPKDNDMLVRLLESNAGVFLESGNRRNNGKQ